MSIFDAGEKLIEQMFEIATKPCNYLRGGEVIARDIPAKLGRTLAKVDDLATGISIRFEMRDFILRVEDLPDIGEPQKGDEIVFEHGIYIVTAPDGEPCWRWHTRQSHTQIRIHAKYAGVAEDDDN